MKDPSHQQRVCHITVVTVKGLRQPQGHVILSAMKPLSMHAQFDAFIAKVVHASGDAPSQEMLDAMRAFFFLGANAVLATLMTPMSQEERQQVLQGIRVELAAMSFLQAVSAGEATVAPRDRTH